MLLLAPFSWQNSGGMILHSAVTTWKYFLPPSSALVCVFAGNITITVLPCYMETAEGKLIWLSTWSWSLCSRGRNKFLLWYSFRNRELYQPRTSQHEFLIIFHKFTISCALCSKYNFYTPCLLHVLPEFDVTESYMFKGEVERYKKARK